MESMLLRFQKGHLSETGQPILLTPRIVDSLCCAYVSMHLAVFMPENWLLEGSKIRCF